MSSSTKGKISRKAKTWRPLLHPRGSSEHAWGPHVGAGARGLKKQRLYRNRGKKHTCLRDFYFLFFLSESVCPSTGSACDRSCEFSLWLQRRSCQVPSPLALCSWAESRRFRITGLNWKWWATIYHVNHISAGILNPSQNNIICNFIMFFLQIFQSFMLILAYEFLTPPSRLVSLVSKSDIDEFWWKCSGNFCSGPINKWLENIPESI